MKRKNIAAANWKMNTELSEGLNLFTDLMSRELATDCDVVICAPATHLFALSQQETPNNVHLGAQNMYHQAKGAYTGEISASMIKSVRATHVIIGHSERRAYFDESDGFLGQKIKTALESGLTPIFCCGEALEIRKAGNHVNHVIEQIKASYEGFEAADVSKIVIAYEPIWAIGTGETASPEQAQEMHAAIRAHLAEAYGQETADSISILYGGSVKPANAKEIFGQADVDGGLVGGASLDAESFASIINAF